VAINGWLATAYGGVGVWWKEGLLFGGRGGKRTPAVDVAAATMERRRSARSRATQGRGGENGFEPLLDGPGADNDGRVRGRPGCLRRRISRPNLRPEWVRVDAFEQLCLFGSPRWTMYSIRADALERGVVVRFGSALSHCISVCPKSLDLSVRAFVS
jgi:hypothetical protein